MNGLVLALLLIQGTGSIDGAVVRAGSNEPLPETQIVIAAIGRPLRESRVAATDAEGKFRVANLPAGSYRLFFEREGYVRGEYGQRSPGKPGVEVEIASSKTISGIVQPLTAASVIYGRIVSAASDPIPNATVRVLKAAYRDGARSLQAVQSAQTNDLGEYRLFGLIPGSYFLSAIPAPSPTIQDSRINIPSGNGTAISSLQNILATGTLIDPRALDGGTDLTVYFPGTTDAAAATGIDLKPGASFRVPDLRTVRARSVGIRGEIVDERGQPVTAEVLTLTRAGSEGSAPIRNLGLGASRTFEFSGLLPGVYELNATDNGMNAQKLGNMTITVGAENIENLRLIMRPAWTLKGRFVQEDPAAAPASIRVQLRGSHGMGSIQPNPTAPDGTFTLTRLAPDDYKLTFFGLSENVFVRSARFRGVDVLNSTLRIDRELLDELEIVLSQRTGSLDAVVVSRDQKPSAATTVVLIPDPSRRQRFELYRTSTTDSSGRAALLNIPPGNYSLFAWTDIEANAWQDPEVMRQYEDRGAAVTITEGSKGSAVVTAIE